MENLLRTVEANPEDRAARLVYADALEETGRADQADYLRLELDWRAQPPPAAWTLELAELNDRQRLDAIRTIREVTLWGLREGKQAFERRSEGHLVDLVDVRTFGAAAAAMERARTLSPGTELSFRTTDPCQRLATALLALAGRLEAAWLQRVGRLWALMPVGASTDALSAALVERLGPLTTCEERVLTPGLLRDGLTLDEAHDASAALGAVRVVRSQAFFAWPVREAPAWRSRPPLSDRRSVVLR